MDINEKIIALNELIAKFETLKNEIISCTEQVHQLYDLLAVSLSTIEDEFYSNSDLKE